jgi:hypothetical protein
MEPLGGVEPVAGGVAELSAGVPVAVVVDESVGGVVAVVLLVVVVSVLSGFLLQAPSARLEATRMALVAISDERHGEEIISEGSLEDWTVRSAEQP